MRLANKVAVVTGSSSGIGRATAIRFAEEGAAVCVADLDVRGGEETVAQIKAAGGRAFFHKTDISIESEVRELMNTAARELGGPDILVNNAAAFVFGTVEEASEQDWDRVLNVNVKGYAFCSKYAIPHMRKRGGGSIVNLGSISSFIAQPAFVPYNTSKGAVLQMTRCLAFDLAPDNIRVNCVCPGAIDTPAIMLDAASKGLTKEQVVELNKPLHLIKRMGDPREVANAILFLASEEASFITATPLMVDGGYTAQ